METNTTIVQWLNLVHSSPTFVIRVGGSNENATVECLNVVPKDDGEYWMSGTTILKNGAEIPSVFRIDTNTGGTLAGAYWWIKEKWWDFQNQPDVFKELGVEKSEIFPFDWRCVVDLEEDIYHP
ncbi:hypothetical protein [Halomonas binhaiensis]|uniref:Uncharacterized protein n=1 Tax=Halomonas binhaiensis TaxID=2562282 RepID=A0A5C1NE03_9GAMM|nr:hypothetical protein [Halomonas binhaiensis]QEM80903.1 hypothetical protein E4T21_04555 [Halomonas binhaiensis]